MCDRLSAHSPAAAGRFILILILFLLLCRQAVWPFSPIASPRNDKGNDESMSKSRKQQRLYGRGLTAEKEKDKEKEKEKGRETATARALGRAFP
jgi:hypothetical protein